MEVSQIQAYNADGTSVLRGEVTSHFLAEAFSLWYRFPGDLAPYVDAGNGDPFVAALLVSAMRCGEPLEIHAPVSPKLLAATDRIQERYCSFDPSLSKVRVQAASARWEPPWTDTRARPSALTFSLGLDSWYSLLRNTREHPTDDETIRYLVHVYGFDLQVGNQNEAALEEIRASCKRVTHEFGKILLPVSTNLRNLTDRFADWSLLGHGAGLASIGLALSGAIGRLHVAAGPNGEDPNPCGSHPLLDPLWSTERLGVVYDGGEVGRTSKLNDVVQCPLALETLRVCYQDPPPRYNCGACWKCLQTMIRLEMNGNLRRTTAFSVPLSPSLIRDAEIEPVTATESLEHLLTEVRAWGENPEMEAAIAERVAERLPARPSTLKEIDFVQSRVALLAPLQREVARLRASMERQTLWAQQATRDVEERDAIILDLQHQVAEMTAWAQRSVQDVTARDELIRELQCQIAGQEAHAGPAREEPATTASLAP